MVPRRSVAFALKAVTNQIRRMMDNNDIHREMGNLTGMHYGVIHYICRRSREEDVFQRDVEAEFNIRRSTATGILQLMEKNGLLIREPVEYDARLKKLVLTDKARTLQEQVYREIEAMEEKMLRGVSDEELATFLSILEKIARNIGE